MNASEYQARLKRKLEQHYDDVVLEWPMFRDANDSVARNLSQYYPRSDVAVGPFSLNPGRNSEISIDRVNLKLRHELERLHANNANPRCLLAIEVVFSGTSKHILGDMLNASAIGLYGIVVCSQEMLSRAKRNREYLIKLADLGKLQLLPFQNILILSTDELEQLL